MIYVHGRPYADPDAGGEADQAARIYDPDRQEAAAIAGAKAEAKGRSQNACPYRQTPALRVAWHAGWTISRQDQRRRQRREPPPIRADQ